MEFRAGKLNPKLLNLLIKKYCRKDKNITTPPMVGEDATTIYLNKRHISVTSDPITFATDEIGFYAVNVNANDIATMGAVPKWFFATILLPEGKVSRKKTEKIFAQISRACEELGITLAGGHTEVTPDLPREIIIGTMIGELYGEPIRSSGAKVGDRIILTKGIAIEGTSIIAREKSSSLKGISRELIRRSKKFLHNPGISVVKEALLAVKNVKVNSMHDPTEGGLAMGLYELSIASDVGIRIYQNRVRIYKETEILSKEFGIDPFCLIASGALIITISPKECKKLENIYAKNGVEYSIIGEVTPKDKGLKIIVGGTEKFLSVPKRDGIVKIFE